MHPSFQDGLPKGSRANHATLLVLFAPTSRPLLQFVRGRSRLKRYKRADLESITEAPMLQYVETNYDTKISFSFRLENCWSRYRRLVQETRSALDDQKSSHVR